MKTACIIQARMGSTRFPGKNLVPILNDGRPNPICALELIHNACARVPEIAAVIIACPLSDVETFQDYADQQLEYTGKEFLVFGGSEDDVYRRVMAAALFYGVDVVVDITGDCPLVPAFEIRRMLQAFLADDGLRYMSNVFPDRLVPDGWDVQIYRTGTMVYNASRVIEKGHSGWNLAQLDPGPQVFMDPEFPEYGQMRITLDTPEDLQVIKKIAALYMDAQCLDTVEKGRQFLEYLAAQPPEWWDNREIQPKEAGRG